MFTVLLIACINDKRKKKWPTPCVLRGGEGGLEVFWRLVWRKGSKRDHHLSTIMLQNTIADVNMWQLYWAPHFPPVSYIIKSFRRVYLGFQISRKGWVMTHCWMEVYTGSLKTSWSLRRLKQFKLLKTHLLLFTIVSIKDRWLTNLRDTNISSRLQLNFH